MSPGEDGFHSKTAEVVGYFVRKGKIEAYRGMKTRVTEVNNLMF